MGDIVRTSQTKFVHTYMDGIIQLLDFVLPIKKYVYVSLKNSLLSLII